MSQRETELEEAEQAFREAEAHRREIDEQRRRIGEETAGRRASAEALQRSLAGSEREAERLRSELELVGQKLSAAGSEREGLESDIEQMDGQTAPLAEKLSQLEDERRRIVEKIEELEEAKRAMTSRKDLLDARRADIEETPGSRFLKANKGRAVGLLKDLVTAQEGLERALVAALGPLADAVVYEDPRRALEDAPQGDGAIFAIAAGGPVPLGLSGERKLLSVVSADPAARGIVSTVLKDVYLASSADEAATKQGEHPQASFVTPDGLLIGPAVIHTAKEADARAREIRAELQVLAHDLSAIEQQLKPKRERVHEIGGEVGFLREQIEAADTDITAYADRLSSMEKDLAGTRKEEEMLTQRLAAVEEGAAVWRDQLAALGPVTSEELPELPPLPQAPMHARVAVETLRRSRSQYDQRLAQLRAERDQLAALDPVALRAELSAAEAAKAQAEQALARAGEAFGAAAQQRELAASSEREAAEREAAVNKGWRDASTELDRLREMYEDEDRLRGDIERRVREAERLIREGFSAEPEEALAALADDDDVSSIEKKQEMVQRRLALLGRVNLLATGELEAVQERYDFMSRELDDVRKARRDLLEVIAQVDQEITDTFMSAYRDVAMQFERLVSELFPGGEGRLVLTDPASPLESGIEIEASPGRKRVKRISLLSGGEKSLAALAYLFAIFMARPSPFYLMDEVEPALDDTNLHRFLRLIEGFASDSQVLIVTHQKRTMEVASMLYGVSLNKDGTTKVVMQRLDKQEIAEKQARIEAQREAASEAFAVQSSADDEPVLEVPASEPVG